MDKMTGKIEIIRYNSDSSKAWNEFVTHSRNSTFLFHRDYMDYHSDRFADHSLMAYQKGKLIAMLPAALSEGGVLSSHPGLTYGGWILPNLHVDGAEMLEMMSALGAYCRKNGIKGLYYKPLPYIYSVIPSQEDLYALFRCGARCECVNLSSAIDLRSEWKFDMSKRQQVRKARAGGVIVREYDDWDSFWKMLADCLRERHEAEPVHSLAEIKLLTSRFPRNIRLFVAERNGTIEAGVCVYDTGLVAHSQYAATTADGRRDYALTLLYHTLLTEAFADRNYFDFGTSNEDRGRVLNSGLLHQKFSMGATGVAYMQYSLRYD